MKIKLAKSIGQKVKFLREDLDISQEEFADRAGIHVTNLSKLENGIRLPKVETLFKICQALDVPVSRVLPGEKTENSDPLTEEIVSILSTRPSDEKRVMLNLLKAYRRQKL